MITNLIINALYAIVYLISSPLRLLNNVVIPDSFNTAILTVGGYLKALDTILPIDTILLLLGISITIELAYFSYKVIMWIIKRFPTQS
jgi:hypothetical protein